MKNRGKRRPFSLLRVAISGIPTIPQSRFPPTPQFLQSRSLAGPHIPHLGDPKDQLVLNLKYHAGASLAIWCDIAGEDQKLIIKEMHDKKKVGPPPYLSSTWWSPTLPQSCIMHPTLPQYHRFLKNHQGGPKFFNNGNACENRVGPDLFLSPLGATWQHMIGPQS